MTAGVLRAMNTEEYLKLTEVEDAMWYFRSLHEHVRRELAAVLRTGSRVLDAGCGTGGLILRLRSNQPHWRFSGIDFMPLAVDLARRRCGAGVDLEVASVTALPAPADSADAVVSADVICQVENPGTAIAEFMRVLRPGGIVVINVPAYMWMWSYHDDSCQTKHRYTRPEVAELLRRAGFVDIRTTHWNALPFPVVWAKRKLFRTDRDTSDVKAYPWWVDRMFGALMSIEHAWRRVGGNWAWGTSVFAVARKPSSVSPEGIRP